MVPADVTVDLPAADQLMQLSKKALHFLMVREGWTPPRRTPIDVVTGKFIEPGAQWPRKRLVRELQLLRTARLQALRDGEVDRGFDPAMWMRTNSDPYTESSPAAQLPKLVDPPEAATLPPTLSIEDAPPTPERSAEDEAMQSPA
jgi:hypothetical protein